MHAPIPLSFKQRVLSAGIWSLAGYGCNQLLRFGSNLLMTRLLVPDMFGVMAMAYVVMTGLAMFSDLGFKPNVVQSKRGGDPVFLNTIWVTQILRGLLLWSFALTASLIIYSANHIGVVPQGSVYGDPQLPLVVAVLSIAAVAGGFESTKLLEASRNLSLKRIAWLEVGTQIVALLCMLAWAWFDRSIWALVAGGVVSSVVRAMLSHVWLPGVSNRWQWDNTAFREIFHFGKWMFASSILGFFVNSGDRLLLSTFVDKNVLGVYAIAFLIYSSIEQILMRLIGEVSFPAISEVVRDRLAQLKSNYYRFNSVIASFAYFCSGFLMVSGQTLIGLLYDHRYEQAGWMLQVLSACLLAVPIRVAQLCFLALGMPKVFTQPITIRAITLYTLTPAGFYFFGLPGGLAGIVAGYFSAIPTILFHGIKHDLFDFRKEFLALMAVPAGMLIAEGFNLVIGCWRPL
jgi:O-antigen/teichoic acid export membrane protein